MGLGYEPRGRDFPRRNRIVSGLCLGTVVVEAAERSGSLITAQFALDQGREVFAVPGSPLDPRAAGPNNLIRQRATLVRGAEDVLEVLLPMLTGREPQQAHMEDESSTSTPKPLYWDEWDFDGDSLDAPGPGTAAAEWPSEADEEAGEPPETLRQRLLECLGVTPAEVDDVARALGVTAREIQVLLFELELSGDVQRHGGGRVARRA
jgi:DNA processing protein